MKLIAFSIALLCSSFCFSQQTGLLQTSKSPFVKLKNVNIGDVTWNKGFWADKVQVCEKQMVPALQKYYMDKALDNFKVAAGLQEGEYKGAWWLDGDFYKWMEAMVISYSDTRNKKIDVQLDSIINILAKAQQPDGYINTVTQIGHGIGTFAFTTEQPFNNKTKWQSDRELEVYNMGHLITAAVIHHRITGKTNLLNIAIKAADNMYEFFKVPSVEKAALIYNPPQIMGLIELYRTTGNKKYVVLANTFLDMMGKGRRSQTENRLPVREVQNAWGHAVIGTYLYCGMADVYAETGDTALLNALKRLSADVVDRKMYITGGVGSYHKHVYGKDTMTECFGEPYDLPNATAYNETCANIGNAMWNWRMLGITGDAKYADVMEQVFYNSLLSSVSLDGESYFYTNVLRGYGKNHQLQSNDAYQRWNLPRGGVCCPPNAARTIAEMSNYAYSVDANSVYVNLYGSNTLKTSLANGADVNIVQSTEYPWAGTIRFTFTKAKSTSYALNLRIPSWANGASVSVNGKLIKNITAGKYFKLLQEWKAGDVIILNLPMNVRYVSADPRVKQDINSIAIVRGPIVYCIESADIDEGTSLDQLYVDGKNNLKPAYQPTFLSGVTVLEGTVLKRDSTNAMGKSDKNYTRVKARFVPYYVWNNRGIGEMAVWLPLIK